jgi:hypothetical protein
VTTQQVRALYGASLSPDATVFAHFIDDGGYPRAVQRFLCGLRASSSRDVKLPVEGPATRVVHSADGHLAGLIRSNNRLRARPAAGSNCHRGWRQLPGGGRASGL